MSLARLIIKLLSTLLAFVLSMTALISLGSAPASAAEFTPGPRAFGDVYSGVLRGDMVMANNSNLLAGAGVTPQPARIDGRTDGGCSWQAAANARSLCNNSSSAVLDIPAGARVVAARLYVMNTIYPKSLYPNSSRPETTEVKLAGPSDNGIYRQIGDNTSGVPKIAESADGQGKGYYNIMRQTVWDVTSLVSQQGGGSYTIADTPVERSGSWTPWANWTIAAVYEWDDTAGIDYQSMSEAEKYRFIPRSISWVDGNRYFVPADGALSVTASGIIVPDAGQPRFAKTFHQVGHANLNYRDRASVNGVTHGDNNVAGNSAPPVGVVLGTQPECNTTVDVQNETTCYLGNFVTDSPIDGTGYLKNPGTGFRNSANRTNTNNAAFDADVIRVPDAAIPAGTRNATFSLQAIGDEWLNVGMAAISVDLAGVDPTLTKSYTKVGEGRLQPGDTVEFSLTAANLGKDEGVNALVTDALPAGLTYVPGSMRVTTGLGQGTKTDAAGDDSARFDTTNNTVYWQPGSDQDRYTQPETETPQSWEQRPDGNPDYLLRPEDADGPQTLTFRATINEDQQNQQITNTASFTLRGVRSNIPIQTSDQAIINLTPPQPGGYTLSKRADTTAANPGDTITYTVTVTQTGDEAVTASFRDDLNAVTGATYITGSATTDRGTISGNLDWNGTLDVNQTATIRYQMRINNDTATGATVKNTVTPGENGTCKPGECTATASIPVRYVITKTADKSSAAPG